MITRGPSISTAISTRTRSPPVSARTRLRGKRRRAFSATAAYQIAAAAASSIVASVAATRSRISRVSDPVAGTLLCPSREAEQRFVRTGIDKYQIIDTRGRGNYGVVYKAQHRENGSIVAIKKTTIDGNGEGVPCTTLREVSLLQRLNHSNIVKILDVISQSRNLYVVFDFMATDLQKFIMMNRGQKYGIGKDLAKAYLYQLADALAYCHTNRVLHRDLKPENLLIDNSGQLKVADFGLARAFAVRASSYTHEVVTLWYRAPEILFGAARYSAAVDMWSAGCIFLEMLVAKPLFPGTSELDQLLQIFRTLGTPNETRWPGVSLLPDYQTVFPQWPPQQLNKLVPGLCAESHEIAKKLLTYKPEERMRAREVLDHKFFSDNGPATSENAAASENAASSSSQDTLENPKKRVKTATQSAHAADKCKGRIKSPLQDNVQHL